MIILHRSIFLTHPLPANLTQAAEHPILELALTPERFKVH
jgi:hypothetical protein